MKLLEQPELYRTLCLNGRALVERYYDWNVISAKLGRRIIEIYKNKRSIKFYFLIIFS